MDVARSRSRRLDTFDPHIYAKYPGLDSILLHYLDIESLIQRHHVNPAAFETHESLNLLAQRFDLPPSRTFPAFLAGYDRKYATVRSYFLPDAEPGAIILKAAEAGELQAFYLGLRQYPKYKNPIWLKAALRRAARGNQQVMIDLIKDLGETSSTDELLGMAEGGHLEPLKHLISETPDQDLFQSTIIAVRHGHLATAKYLITLWTPLPVDWNGLIYSAGVSGNSGMIDYIISQGGNNYTQLILGAIARGHLELVMRYMEKPGLDYNNILAQAILFKYLDLAKLVVRYARIDKGLLNDLI
jgi:hypothetical protein